MLMRFLYWVDSPDNLFPSIHCLTSWMCYIGIRGRRNIPLGYRIFSCLMAIAVFISTLTTKQHVLVDVVGGVLLAEGCYMITGRTRLSVWYGRFFDRLAARITRS
jgi:membrane-associated phospholipid phosphatase